MPSIGPIVTAWIHPFVTLRWFPCHLIEQRNASCSAHTMDSVWAMSGVTP